MYPADGAKLLVTSLMFFCGVSPRRVPCHRNLWSPGTSNENHMTILAKHGHLWAMAHTNESLLVAFTLSSVWVTPQTIPYPFRLNRKRNAKQTTYARGINESNLLWRRKLQNYDCQVGISSSHSRLRHRILHMIFF